MVRQLRQLVRPVSKAGKSPVKGKGGSERSLSLIASPLLYFIRKELTVFFFLVFVSIVALAADFVGLFHISFAKVESVPQSVP